VGELVNLRTPEIAAEAELVEACRRGDRAALEVVLSTHSPYLERLLSRVIGPSGDLEDVLQSTFVAAIRAFPRFRGEAQVRTWLARIAIRTAHERLRSAEHRRRSRIADLEAVADAQSEHGRGERRFEARRKLARLYEHLEAIGPKKRLAFVLHVFEGHALEDVAALMDASLAATKSRVFWARRELLRRAARDPLLRELAAELGSTQP